MSARLTSPVVTTYVNTEKIDFERVKAGIWGFRSDKSETVNGYECKVCTTCVCVLRMPNNDANTRDYRFFRNSGVLFSCSLRSSNLQLGYSYSCSKINVSAFTWYINYFLVDLP